MRNSRSDCGRGLYRATPLSRRIAWLAGHARRRFVSSGFDPSPVDLLGCVTVTSGGFKDIATRLVGLAENVCGGKIVFSHEGGYSPVHVPFCGLAVLEALTGHETGVQDPFAQSFDASPAHALQPWQDSIIARAALIADALRL